jgi:signal peptidase II
MPETMPPELLPPEAMPRSARVRWLIGITILTVLIDQLTKFYAVAVLKVQPPQSYLGDILRISYAENKGAFLGLFGNLSETMRWAILVTGNSALMVGLVLYLALGKKVNAWTFFTFALVFAGGIGNLIDRVRINAVIDFLNLGIGPLRTGIFNVADMAITAGFFMLVWQVYRGDEEGQADSAAASVTPPAASTPTA